MAHLRLTLGAVAVTALVVTAVAIGTERAGASAAETVTLAAGTTVALTTPPFIVKGGRYAFTWPGGGPPQTFTVKDVRPDGWILVEVAEENIDLNLVPYGRLPVRWLNVGIATSVQEMRPLLH